MYLSLFLTLYIILCTYSEVRGVIGSADDRIKLASPIPPPPNKIHFFYEYFGSRNEYLYVRI